MRTITKIVAVLAGSIALGTVGGVVLADYANASHALPVVIGHRGTNDGTAPENSKAAIVAGLQAGAQGVEVDVRLTSDGKAVIMHDATVDRLTNCTGLVSSLTYAQFRACDLTNGETPLNVYEAAWKVSQYGGMSAQLWLHLKTGTPSAELRAAIMAAVDKYGLRSRTVLMADESEPLYAFRKWSSVHFAHIFNAADLDDAGEGWSAPYEYLVPYEVPVTLADVAGAHAAGQKVLSVEDHWGPLSDVTLLHLDGIVANDVANAVTELR